MGRAACHIVRRVLTSALLVGCAHALSPQPLSALAAPAALSMAAQQESAPSSSYTISFAPGAMDVTDMPDSQSAVVGKRVPLGLGAQPRRAGYAFVGWAVQSGDTLLPVATTADLDALFKSLGLGASNVAVRAQWSMAYTVAFETGDASELPSLAAVAGTAVTLPTPARDGATFAGWTLADEPGAATVSTTAALDALAEPGGTLTLYAQWGQAPAGTGQPAAAVAAGGSAQAVPTSAQRTQAPAASLQGGGATPSGAAADAEQGADSQVAEPQEAPLSTNPAVEPLPTDEDPATDEPPSSGELPGEATSAPQPARSLAAAESLQWGIVATMLASFGALVSAVQVARLKSLLAALGSQR